MRANGKPSSKPKKLFKQILIVNVHKQGRITHSPASLYEALAPAEARRILKRVEFHFTPKHGSWLNMAEIEIGIFERMALKCRIGDEATLKAQVAALEAERNKKGAKINWRFTSTDARVKLERLYPKLD